MWLEPISREPCHLTPWLMPYFPRMTRCNRLPVRIIENRRLKLFKEQEEYNKYNIQWKRKLYKKECSRTTGRTADNCLGYAKGKTMAIGWTLMEKRTPQFYPKGCAVSPFNALIMALHSDQNGYKTNLYTLFNEAKMRGESVREHERGVPFNWYAWNQYVNQTTRMILFQERIIWSCPKRKRTNTKGIHNREIRVLFNIDQTLLPLVDERNIRRKYCLRQQQPIWQTWLWVRTTRCYQCFQDKMNENLISSPSWW